MTLHKTPYANRLHIGIFGKRNVGKSSLINAITGQDLAIVSEEKGTTTDPVSKSMELLPLGPVVLIDTPGMDDEGVLGEKRIKKTRQVLGKIDISLLVVDHIEGVTELELELMEEFHQRKIPFVMVHNKIDDVDDYSQISDCYINPQDNNKIVPEKNNLRDNKARAEINISGDEKTLKKINNSHEPNWRHIHVSAKTGFNIHTLKELMGKMGHEITVEKPLVKDLFQPGDLILLVTPIDESAPKGRLILPQQQVIREVVEAGGVNVVIKETQLEKALETLGCKPALVITDSQVFDKVADILPKGIKLTSFSILFARFKGELDSLASGAGFIEELKDGDRILISEGCSHHRQCNDIGTVKLPKWIENYSKKKLNFQFTSGVEFPEDLSPYALVVHCGGCLLNQREMESRINKACMEGIPMTNYGILIAYINGIIDRSLEPFIVG